MSSRLNKIIQPHIILHYLDVFSVIIMLNNSLASYLILEIDGNILLVLWWRKLKNHKKDPQNHRLPGDMIKWLLSTVTCLSIKEFLWLTSANKYQNQNRQYCRLITIPQNHLIRYIKQSNKLFLLLSLIKKIQLLKSYCFLHCLHIFIKTLSLPSF